eukprot:TRINITY_DN2265_c0_g1::TRINITY_DN2265_c0_g1_i1::g.6812::m.6812 TRINITY_DN2265_c0_g1::TRINITY_DN2265_c0_g1_i1::g.6812  ORF type:complete len:587 (+),score=203.31,sp/O18824/SCRB1_BOVIN/25.31/4e-28,CD36/PF01130.16/1.3e-74 TRINITY_DN2265_c0_g1_i1:37-1761(+)
MEAALLDETSVRIPWFRQRRFVLFQSILVALVIASIILSILIPAGIDQAVEDGIEEAITVDNEDSEGYDTWASTVPEDGEDDKPEIYYTIRMFNVTNREEIMNGGKPIVQEVGPYVYRVYIRRHNIRWYNNEGYVEAYKQKYYVFDQSRSKGSPNDKVILPDVPLAILKFGAQHEPGYNESSVAGLKMLNAGVKQMLGEPMDFFRTFTVGSFYWGGVPDPMWGGAGLPDPRWPGLEMNITSEDDARRRCGLDRVNTGKHDIDHAHQYELYRGQDYIHTCILSSEGVEKDEYGNTLPTFGCDTFEPDWNAADPMVPLSKGWNSVWGSAEANYIRGTDGTQTHPKMDSSEYPVYVEEVYRSVNLENKNGEKNDDLHGIELTRYTLKDEDLQSARTNPANIVYFMDHLDGLLNMQPVYLFDAYASKPHFLDADPLLVEDIEGLSPSSDEHNTYLDVEYNTGITFRARKRLQANVVLSDWSYGTEKMFEKLGYRSPGNKTILPLVWLEESFELSESDATDFKDSVYYYQDLADDLQIALPCVAAFFFLVAVAFPFIYRSRATRYARRPSYVHQDQNQF